MQPWQAEHGVDAALATRLVAATWPELGGTAIHVGSGWDVDVWRFGALAVRFPRRALGAACLDNELAILPHVAELVPVPVPRPLRIGAPVLGYPSRFYAHVVLPGAPILRAALDDAALCALAPALGAFLRALHAIPLAPVRAAGLADDPRGDVGRVAARGRDWLARVPLAPALAAAAGALLGGPPPADVDARVLVHGDFHAGNLLVDRGEVSGVIDWGDAAAGDPAIDLAIGWSLVPAPGRAAFLAAYGPVAPEVWQRARINAVSRQGLALLAWGHGLGDATVVDWATRSLTRALASG